MPPGLNPVHLLVVLVVALVVLGPERLPDAARQLARALGQLRGWSVSLESQFRDALDLDDGGTDHASGASNVESTGSDADPPPMQKQEKEQP
jgi:Tat protein translocase TatB subunit